MEASFVKERCFFANSKMRINISLLINNCISWTLVYSFQKRNHRPLTCKSYSYAIWNDACTYDRERTCVGCVILFLNLLISAYIYIYIFFDVVSAYISPSNIPWEPNYSSIIRKIGLKTYICGGILQDIICNTVQILNGWAVHGCLSNHLCHWLIVTNIITTSIL